MNPADHTILIVDDEEALRDSVAFDFRRKKFNVLTAACGRDALKIVETNKVDVVLSDVRMPNGTGIELLQWIKQRDVFLPVLIFITAYADLTVPEAFDMGADAVFSKPFDRMALYNAVVEVVGDPKAKLRRKGGRVSADLSLGLRVISSGQNIAGEIKNLGRGGFFFSTEGKFPAIGDNVEFRLRLPDGKEVIGDGLVRWVRTESVAETPAGCGVEIKSLEDASKDHFYEMVNELKTKSFIPNA